MDKRTLRGIAIGFLLGVALMVLVGATTTSKGPYTIYTQNEYRSYLLDETTGKVWKMGRGNDFSILGKP